MSLTLESKMRAAYLYRDSPGLYAVTQLQQGKVLSTTKESLGFFSQMRKEI